MKFFNGTASWIAPEDGVMQNCEAGRAMLFRRTFQGKGELTVAVSADTFRSRIVTPLITFRSSYPQ